MSFSIQLPVFEGPLDLLLRLIEQRQLEITAISLAEVADQYLAQVRAMERREPAEIAEFLALAAKLILIKSRALLPRPDPPPPPEEDVAEQLARQLREYQQFKRIAEELRTIEEQGQRSFGRAAPPQLPAFPPPPLKHQAHDLVRAVERRLRLLREQAEQPVSLPRPKELTVAEVARRLRDLLTGMRAVTFEDVLSMAATRNEVIVTLWTVLELWKREVVAVEQEQLFGQIVLSRGPLFAEPEEPSAP